MKNKTRNLKVIITGLICLTEFYSGVTIAQSSEPFLASTPATSIESEVALRDAALLAISNDIWSQIEKLSWIQDGHPSAPTIIYVFSDPNCAYCTKFWNDARPLVEKGKVQIRHVLVGIIKEDSEAKAAAILASANPNKALTEHSRVPGLAANASVQDYRTRGPGNSITPLKTISPALLDKLDSNHAFMLKLGVRATPTLVWQRANGLVKIQSGISRNSLDDIVK